MNEKKEGRSEALQHVRENLFITATGVAAFVHTTWAIGTLFGGRQPLVTASVDTDLGIWLAQSWALMAWLVPPMLIAFALDVGQIVTSYRIRRDHLKGRKPYNKYVTFAVFAVATYYLQWAYMAHHLPALTLAPGVRAEWRHFVGVVRDLSLWIVPLLLPLSTMLYTISDMDEAEALPTTRVTRVEIKPVATEQSLPMPAPTLPERTNASASGAHTGEATGYIGVVDDGYQFTCPHCGKQDTKVTANKAQAALNVHIGRYCPAKKLVDA